MVRLPALVGTYKTKILIMGQLGQQLQVNVPAGTGQVIINGMNQAANFAKWQGTADGPVVKTDGWYWVGQVEIVCQNTSNNSTTSAPASVPEFQEFSDWYSVTVPPFPPPPGPTHGPTQGVTQGIPGPITPQPSSTENFATTLPGGSEKPRHGKHEETPLRGEQEVKPAHGKHEEKPSHGEREEKPRHGEHKPSHRAEE